MNLQKLTQLKIKNLEKELISIKIRDNNFQQWELYCKNQLDYCKNNDIIQPEFILIIQYNCATLENRLCDYCFDYCNIGSTDISYFDQDNNDMCFSCVNEFIKNKVSLKYHNVLCTECNLNDVKQNHLLKINDDDDWVCLFSLICDECFKNQSINKREIKNDNYK